MIDRAIATLTDFDTLTIIMAGGIIAVIFNFLFLKIIPAIFGKVKIFPNRIRQFFIKGKRSYHYWRLKRIKRARHHQYIILHQVWITLMITIVVHVSGTGLILIIQNLEFSNDKIRSYFALGVSVHLYLSILVWWITFIETSKLLKSAHKLKIRKRKKPKIISGTGLAEIYVLYGTSYYLYYDEIHNNQLIKDISCSTCKRSINETGLIFPITRYHAIQICSNHYTIHHEVPF